MSKTDNKPAPETPAAAPAPAPSKGPQGLLMAGVALVLAALAFLIFVITTGKGAAPANQSAEANAAAPAPDALPGPTPAPEGNTAAPAPPAPTPGGGQLLPSGLRLEIVREGRGRLVAPTDTVYFRYELRKFGGPVLESNLNAPQPAVMPAAGLVPGFREGLTHMRPGGEARFWVPPHLGYGNEVPPGAGFGPNDTLEFRVRLERSTPAGSEPAPAPAAGQ